MTPVNILHRGPKAVSARPQPAFCCDLTPLDYARLVHPRGAGAVAFCGPGTSKAGNKVWLDSRWSPHALATREADLGRFRFMSFATWPRQGLGDPKPKRTEANAVAVCANWIDLDFYKADGWQGVPPVQVLEAVRNVCEDRGWPAPSYATHSGRGLLVVWLYAAVPAQPVLARHRAVQETLHQAFAAMGSDASAKTITKVFRMPRTYNERSGLPVSLIWPHAVADIARTTFDELAEAVLPYRRQTRKEKEAAAAAAKAEREAKRAASRKPRQPRASHAGAKLGGRSYWQTLRDDLERLFEHRHGIGPVPDGEGRNSWILAFSYAAAWAIPAAELEGYVRDQAARCGLTEQEALDKTTSIRSKALSAARGEKVRKGTRTFDPRYKPGGRYFVSDDLLNIRPMEMRRAGLRLLVDATRRAELAAGRVEKSRRAAGVRARSGQQTLRREVGILAMEMVGDLGMSVKEAASFFATSPRWMDNALRDARTTLALAMPRPEPEPVAAVVEDVADTLEPTHEVLRGTRVDAGTVVVPLARPAYTRLVTTVGCTSSRPTPAARQPARRALPCPVPA